MADDSLTSTLDAHLAKMLAGDRASREVVFRHASGRLERLARKMLRGFPGVQRWADTGDVLQSALLRLLRALEEARPTDLRAFFALSTEMIRRELLDLARHFYGPLGPGAHHASQAGQDSAEVPAHERPDLTHEPAALAGWREFHEQVRQLPAEEREVVELLFYQELPQAEAAALLGVTVRTVQRRWQAALVRLHGILKDHWPEVGA